VSAPGPQLFLAFDYGTRRLGVASGDTLTRTARALTTLDMTAGPPWPDIAALVAEYRPAQLVVGVPYNMDGSPTRLTSAARKFARELSLRHGLQVALVDERQSSQEAEAQLREARRQGVKRRRVTHADVDMAAAKVLLERWLETPQAAEIIHPGRH